MAHVLNARLWCFGRPKTSLDDAMLFTHQVISMFVAKFCLQNY